MYPGTRHSVSWSSGVLWRWWSVYQGISHSVSWSGVISWGDGVCIQELGTLYHDQGVISGGDGVCIQELDTLCHDQGWSLEVMEWVSRNKTLCIMIKGDLWRWWSVYSGTRHSVAWSGVISGSDGVCIQELDTLFHDQGCSMEVWWSVFLGTTHSLSWSGVISGGDGVWYPGTRHSEACSGVISGSDGVCIQELDTLCHDQRCSMEVIEFVSRN